MSDLTINIPLPEGTQFIEAKAQSSVATEFDGKEVRFFTSNPHRSIRVASFTVEIVDPDRAIFETTPWIAWGGDQPGDYLFKANRFDITKIPLNWRRPSTPVLLTMEATLENEIVTYIIEARNNRGRIQDLTINVPLPPEATLISVEAPLPFVYDFDGKEVSFSAVEPARRVWLGPFIIKAKIGEAPNTTMQTHAWAMWKNIRRRGTASGDTRTGDVVVFPAASQTVVSDPIGDVPFSDYDLTSVALQAGVDRLNVVYHTTGNQPLKGENLTYRFEVNIDCGGRPEFRLIYNHKSARLRFEAWQPDQSRWQRASGDVSDRIQFGEIAGKKTISFAIPYDLINQVQNFCWRALAINRITTFRPNPPNEVVLGNFQRHNQASITPSIVEIAARLPALETSTQPGENQETQTETDIGNWGKIAIPLNNGQGVYDTHVFSMSDGQPLLKIPNTHQPDMRIDGLRMLLNRDGSYANFLAEYNFETQTQAIVSATEGDAYPSYDPWGNRLSYISPDLTPNRDRGSFIFVQCSLQQPQVEAEARCRDIGGLGALIPATHRGEIRGHHPIWLANNMIAYTGCDTWNLSQLCGIYMADSGATKGLSQGSNPVRLTTDQTDLPTDAHGDTIVFMSYRRGNWEVYATNNSVRLYQDVEILNLSNHAEANDGLPTLSPDGNWVAFLSDRGGHWAVWVVPVRGGEVEKRFDLPTNAPWLGQNQPWTDERISWGY